jgi:hypothetical protein
MSGKGIEQKRKEWAEQLRSTEVELIFLRSGATPPKRYSNRFSRGERVCGLMKKVKFLKLKLDRSRGEARE